jgi:hypothetical protein
MDLLLVQDALGNAIFDSIRVVDSPSSSIRRHSHASIAWYLSVTAGPMFGSASA